MPVIVISTGEGCLVSIKKVHILYQFTIILAISLGTLISEAGQSESSNSESEPEDDLLPSMAGRAEHVSHSQGLYCAVLLLSNKKCAAYVHLHSELCYS